MPGNRLHSPWFALLVAATVLLPVRPGAAQGFGEDGPAVAELSNCNVPSEPTAKRLLDSAEKALGEKNWKIAVRNYQEALAKYPEFVYEVKTGFFQGIRRYCTDRLRALPPEARAAYRDAYDSRARTRFEEAMRTLDRKALQAVAEDFPLAGWADRAAGVLGALLLEEGSARVAAPYLERACASDLPEVASAWFLPLASAYTRLGDKERLERLQARFLSVVGDKTLMAGGNPIDVANTIRDWAARIPVPAEGGMSPAPHVAADRWECFGGDAGRTRLMFPSLDLPPRMWSTTVPGGSTFHMNHPEYMIGVTSIFNDDNTGYFPVVADGVVYLHNDGQVFAYELLSANPSGQRLWSYPGKQPTMGPTDVIAEQHAIHTCTLTGGRLLVNLAWTRRDMERQLEWLDVKLALPNRALIALDAQSGRLLWRLGGLKLKVSEQESFADLASFAEAPAAVGNDLFVGATYQANDTNPIQHYLCKVDARTGDLLWKTNICSGFLEMNLFNNPTRESVGTPVTLWRDTALYCSNMGVVAAVDQQSGRIRWLKRYKQNRIAPTRDIRAEPMKPGWTNNPILVSGNRLFVAPTDSPYLVALDCETGRELWTRLRDPFDAASRTQEAGRYLVGVQRDTLVISGLGCIGLDTATGAKRWFWRPDPSEAIVGRGACTRDQTYLPTRGKLVRLGADGAPSGSFRWSERDAGNVLIADNVLLSASPKSVSAYFSLETIQKQVAEQLQKNPDDPDLRYRVGQNHQKAGRDADAAQCFEEVIRLCEKRGDPEARRVAENARQALCRLHMDLGRQAWDRKDRKAGLAEFALAKTWAKDDAAIVEIAFNVAALLADGQAFPEALAELQGVIEKYPAVPYAKGSAREYARENIGRILDAAGRTVYAAFEEQARAALAAAAKSEAVDDYARLIERYPNSLAAEDALLALARRLMAAGRIEDARERLESLLTYHGSARLPDAYYLLVLCLEERGAWASARGALLQLARHYPGASIATAGGPVAAKDLVAERLRRAEYVQLSDAGHRRELHKALHLAWTWNEVGASDLKLLSPAGTMPRDAADFVFLAARDTVRALRWNTGEEVWRAQIERGVASSLFFDQSVIVCGSTTVYALAAKSGQEQWRASVADLYFQEAFISDGILYLDARERADSSLKRMVAMDAATGRTCWSFPYRNPQNNSDAPYFTDSCVIVPTATDRVSLIDREKGTEAGTIDLLGRFGRLLLQSPNRLVAMGSHFTNVACFGVSERAPQWKQTTGAILRDSLVANQNAIAFLERDPEKINVNYLVVMDPQTGKRLVHSVISDRDYPQSTTGIDDHAIYVTFRDREMRDRVYVAAFSLQTGAREWACMREGTGSLTLYDPILTESLFFLNGAIYEMKSNRWTSVTTVIRRADGARLQEISPDPPAGAGAAVTAVENGVFAVIQGGMLSAYTED